MPLEIKTDNIAYLQAAIDLLDAMTVQDLELEEFSDVIENELISQKPFNDSTHDDNFNYTHTMLSATNGQVVYWHASLPETYLSFKKINSNTYIFKLPPEAIATIGRNNISVNDIFAIHNSMSQLRQQLRIINNDSALKQELFLANINQDNWCFTDATSYNLDHLAQSPLLCKALHYDTFNSSPNIFGIPKIDTLLFTYLNTLQHLCAFNNVLPQTN